MYDNFTADTPNALPTGYVAVTYPSAAPAPFLISNASGTKQMVESSAGAAADVLYYKTAQPFTSISESYTFTYTGPTSIIEPFLVYSSGYSGGGSLQGIRVNITETAAGNTSAGSVFHQYYASNASQSYTFGRLHTEPYNYAVGHTYRVSTIADPTSTVISSRVVDTANPGETAYDQEILAPSTLSSFSVYPGVINHFGGAVAINDFSFSPYSNDVQRPRTARRAYDFINSQGENASTSSTFSTALNTTSGGIQYYLPFLKIRHNRITADGASTAPTQNAVPGVDAICLTSNGTTITALTNFMASLTNGCAFIELADEPNNYGTDPNYLTDLPKQAAAFRQAFPTAYIIGPSILNTNGYPNVMQSMAPLAFPTASPPAGVIATSISAWNTHNYTGAAPENMGYGGFVSGCGPTFNQDCGYYGAQNWNDNMSETLAYGLPGVNTEGGGSYGSYPAICGHTNVDLPSQSAYTERGLLYNYKSGHQLDALYKLIDDGGGCTDGFGTYGLVSRFLNNDGTTQGFAAKPSFTSLAYFNSLLFDSGSSASTYTPVPLTYALSGQSPDVESLFLAESDGSYRLVLWSDKELWNFNANGTTAVGAEDPLVSDNVTINLPIAAKGIVYTQTPATGVWSASSTQNSTAITTTVNQYPQIVEIIPSTSSATPVPLPTGIPTPGAVETPTPAPPTPVPTSTSLLYSDNFDADSVGSVPANWLTNSGSAPWAVLTSGNVSGANAYGEGSGGVSTDKSWYVGAYAQTVEEEFDFTATSTSLAPVQFVFVSSATSNTNFTVALTNGDVAYFSSAGGRFSEGTVAGSKSTYIVGHTYGAKVLVTHGSTGDLFNLKVWDLSGAEPAYGSTLTAVHTIAAMTGGIRAIVGGTFGIDDFALGYNGATLPTLP